MKKLITTLLIVTASKGFCQQETFTKIYFRVKSECSCTIQFARNDQPAGQIFKMASDSFLIAIDKGTTGFYITCGKSNSVYLKIPYSPGLGYYRIGGKIRCDKEGFETMIIQADLREKILQ